MSLKENLKTLSLGCAVSGYENTFSSKIKSMFEKYSDDVVIDEFFNVIAYKKGNGKDKKKILITAHYDEIGLMVTSIEDGGFLRFTNVGGVDAKVLPGQEVIVHGTEDLYGIIGSKPPHLLSQEDRKKAFKKEDLLIDTGFSKAYLEKVIQIGDVVTFNQEPREMLNNRISAKCLDNRAGITSLIEILKELDKLNVKNDIVIAATVQEEVGLRGAINLSYNEKPDFAIVIDVCHGKIDGVTDDAYEIGGGPAIAVGPVLSNINTKSIINLAKDNNITYQLDTEPGSTGTEAWAVQVSRQGIPVVLLSIPLKYMHTAVETLDIEDIKLTARLAAMFVSDWKEVK